MKVIKTIYAAIDRLYSILATVGFAAIVIICGMQIVLRRVGMPFMWSEEVCRYIYIALLFMGSAKAFSRGGHLTVDILFAKFPKRAKLVMMFVYYIVILGFTGFMFYSGIQLAKFQWRSPMYTISWFMLGWVDLCIPFGCVLTFLYVIRELYYMAVKGTAYLDNKKGAMG